MTVNHSWTSVCLALLATALLAQPPQMAVPAPGQVF